MRLWYMNSKVLEGFYKSEVYAAGSNKKDAIQAALQAYDHYITKYVHDMGFHPLISSNFPEDEGHTKEAAIKRSEFHKELRDTFAQTEYRGQIDVSS